MLTNHSERTYGKINDCIITLTHLILGWKYVVHSQLTKLWFNTSNSWNYHCECICKTILFYYWPYTPNHCICYKMYTYLLSTIHLTTKTKRAIKWKTQFSQQVQSTNYYSVYFNIFFTLIVWFFSLNILKVWIFVTNMWKYRWFGGTFLSLIAL